MRNYDSYWCIGDIDLILLDLTNQQEIFWTIILLWLLNLCISCYDIYVKSVLI